MGMPPFLQYELEVLPISLKDELELVNLIDPHREEGGPPCVWLDQDTKKCLHYQHRPHICAAFRIGCESCLLYRQSLSL